MNTIYRCVLTAALVIYPLLSMAQSTSQNIAQPPPLFRALAIDPETNITFSEYPVGTQITNQYADHGILFGGDNPFISTDGSNPTSPVLSGTPRFIGSIEGRFINPKDGTTPIVVESFSLDAGYFDELGSTRIEWFDPDGVKLGQRTNSQSGIERFQIVGGNIASWKISIIENEPQGYAIDNVSIVPVQASILFRENVDSEKEGTWGFAGDEIPGFDHVGFNHSDFVYESHPGYPTGTFAGTDGVAVKEVIDYFGVQKQHTKSTFQHDAHVGSNSPVVDFEEIPINIDLANAMQEKIETKIATGAKFQYIDTSSPEALDATLSPASQKGVDDDTFTCVGLVEWAAEQAGHNDGQGFVRDVFESFSYPDVSVFPPQVRIFPLLSPQLLNYSMKFTLTLQSVKEWFQGFFDPTDFIVTDPLGRHVGFSQTMGNVNEIPNAFYSGDGKLEQFLIPNPVPGIYVVQLTGLNQNVFGGIANSVRSQGVRSFLQQGQDLTLKSFVAYTAGAPGDLDFDGDTDTSDRNLLTLSLNTFVNTPNHPGDLNGDGVLNSADVLLLDQLQSSFNGLLDTDSDGLPDPADNCPNISNPDQLDSNSNGVGDACDRVNQPPVANAGPDQAVECAGMGGTSVTLNGSASSDPDSDPLTFTWTGPFGTASGLTPIVTLPMGVNTITLTVSDGKGGTSSAVVTVKVVDTTPPVIKTVTATPNLLWPPNHKMIPVAISVSASDTCSATTTCKILSVRSSEPVNGTGDGDTAPDWVITSNLVANLRAERAGAGNGRTYTLMVQCTDASGNNSTKDVIVSVPHNR